ncbi:unnamed protein product [Malus baccata var. baccata]
MELEAIELPKGLMLGRDGNIYIGLTGSFPLGDVGSNNSLSESILGQVCADEDVGPLRGDPLPWAMWDVTIHPPLGARHPRRHTPGQGLALIPNCHILARAPTTSQAQVSRSTILSALGPDHALTVLFLGTHTRTSQWVTHHGIALARTRLTSEFRWNPKLVMRIYEYMTMAKKP